MKVLYGVQGTDNGHLARARAMVPALKESGIEVDFVFSGRNREDYFNMDIFGPEFRCYQGLTFVTERGRINTLKTLLNGNPVQLVRDILSLDLKDYELVISDFEPVSAWAAKIQNTPSIGISHQSAFSHNVPKVKGFAASRFITKTFARTQYKVGVHWHHFNQPVLPPLIEKLEASPPINNKILVYMGFEQLDDIIAFLTPHTDYDFYVYAKVETARIHNNIKIEPLSHERFHKDLADCAGVISNAGFELSSECIALGKKLFIKPLHGQYEQLSNALALQTLNRATVSDTLDTDRLGDWLELPTHTPIDYPDVAKHNSEWILEKNYNQLDTLLKLLWEDVEHKIEFNDNFGNTIQHGLLA